MEAADIYHAIKRERPDLIGDMTPVEFVRAVTELKAVGVFHDVLPPRWMLEDFPPAHREAFTPEENQAYIDTLNEPYDGLVPLWRIEELMHVIRETVEDYRRERRLETEGPR